MLSHRDAKDLVDACPAVVNAPDPSRLSLLTRAVSMVEAQYGAGWLPGDPGEGSNNWGSITGKFLGQSFPHKDSRPETQPDGSTVQVEYTTDYRKYPTPEAGANDLARLLQSKYSEAVAAVPDWTEVARQLYGYYLGTGPREQAIQDYAQALSTRAAQIQASTLETFPGYVPPAPMPGEGSPTTSWPIVLAGFAVSSIITWLAVRYGPQRRRHG